MRPRLTPGALPGVTPPVLASARGQYSRGLREPRTLRIGVHVCVPVCMSLSVCVYLSVAVPLCVGMCMCASVHVCVCMCIFPWMSPLSQVKLLLRAKYKEPGRKTRPRVFHALTSCGECSVFKGFFHITFAC